jgi:hypothetical protein
VSPAHSDTVTRPDVPSLVAYTSRAMTQRTGVTMRYLRWKRYAFVMGWPAINPATGETLESVADRGAARELREHLALVRGHV